MAVVAVCMAVIVLVGGLTLAYLRSEPPVPQEVQLEKVEEPPAAQGEPSPAIHQETHGDASPAIADGEGDVDIRINQPSNSEVEDR